MSDPYVGEIRMVGFNFAPAGWSLCDGQILAISSNTALFSLLGTQYGGDGVTTFALPNLQGRAAIHQGSGSFGTTYEIGETVGVESVALTEAQLPPHQHPIHASTDAATATSPKGRVMAVTATDSYCPNSDTDAAMRETGPAGTGAAVSVMQPVLCVNFIIATSGIFPSRN